MSKAEQPGGFVVITEVSPNASQGASSKTPPKRDPLQKFFKGEPLALGITQIVCGIIHLLFGIVTDVANDSQPGYYLMFFHTGAPFWYGAVSIISGSLSVAATKNPRIGLVRGSLIMNIITAVASGITIVIYVIHIGSMESSKYYRRYYRCNDETEETETERCSRYLDAHEDIGLGLAGILLCLTVLGFCLSISTSAFGCKTLCRTSYSEVSVVIYQTTASQPSQPSVSAVQTAHPAAGAIQPSFKELENEWSSPPPTWKQ